MLRAIAVLDRIFPEERYPNGYPNESEMAWVDVWDKFSKEYPRYAEKHPSKLGKPSEMTVKRAMGRAE